MQDIVLSTHGICKRYGGRNVVDDVSITVRRGQIYGFVGLNGAGKSTLMRMTSGLIAPSKGSYSLFGMTGRGLSKVRSKCAAIIEGAVFYPTMTGRESVTSFLHLIGKKADPDQYLKAVGLDPKLKTKAKAYSLGMKQRLSIAMALASNAELLMLDEPTNGLDPEGMFEIRELLKSLVKEHGVTVFVSSHILSELSKLATTYGFIHNGRIIKEQSAQSITDSLKRCQIIEVDSACTQKVLAEYKENALISGSKIELVTDESATAVIKRLDKRGVEVQSINTLQADLELYFRQLVNRAGGQK